MLSLQLIPELAVEQGNEHAEENPGNQNLDNKKPLESLGFLFVQHGIAGEDGRVVSGGHGKEFDRLLHQGRQNGVAPGKPERNGLVVELFGPFGDDPFAQGLHRAFIGRRPVGKAFHDGGVAPDRKPYADVFPLLAHVESVVDVRLVDVVRDTGFLEEAPLVDAGKKKGEQKEGAEEKLDGSGRAHETVNDIHRFGEQEEHQQRHGDDADGLGCAPVPVKGECCRHGKQQKEKPDIGKVSQVAEEFVVAERQSCLHGKRFMTCV